MSAMWGSPGSAETTRVENVQIRAAGFPAGAKTKVYYAKGASVTDCS